MSSYPHHHFPSHWSFPIPTTSQFWSQGWIPNSHPPIQPAMHPFSAFSGHKTLMKATSAFSPKKKLLFIVKNFTFAQHCRPSQDGPARQGETNIQNPYGGKLVHLNKFLPRNPDPQSQHRWKKRIQFPPPRSLSAPAPRGLLSMAAAAARGLLLRGLFFAPKCC